jgi:hypothetical protein
MKSVIPGRGPKGCEPGIHNPSAAEYGFRARELALAPRNDGTDQPNAVPDIDTRQLIPDRRSA